MSEQSFQPKDGGELRPDALDVEQHRYRRWRGDLLRGQQRVPLGLHGFDLLEQQFEPIELTADLDLKMHRQGTAIARPQFVEPSPTIATQRLVSGHALGEQQTFDAIWAAKGERKVLDEENYLRLPITEGIL